MGVIVEVENITFQYDKVPVLKELSFEVAKGSFVSILGPNGCGKTTLLKNICGLLKPQKGRIQVGEYPIDHIKPKDLAKKVAVVHQSKEIQFDFPVFEVVLMGRFPYVKKFREESKKDIEIAKEAMKKTGTWYLKDKSIKEISGGERQRVMMARALTQEPEILLLDEPISHLDIKYQISILELCKQLNKEKDLTIIMTLHDINMAARYSDYVLLMNQGKIRAFDLPQKVLTVDNIEEVYEVRVELLIKEGHPYPYILPFTE